MDTGFDTGWFYIRLALVLLRDGNGLALVRKAIDDGLALVWEAIDDGLALARKSIHQQSCVVTG